VCFSLFSFYNCDYIVKMFYEFNVFLFIYICGGGGGGMGGPPALVFSPPT